MHLVLKSRHSTLLKHGAMVRRLLQNMPDLHSVTVYEFSVNSNHVHLLLRAKTRKGFQGFLRVFCGQVAQKISGAVKGHRLKESFWHVPVFSRIVAWGKAFVSARRYVIQNQLEATGEIPYRSRSPKQATRDPGSPPSQPRLTPTRRPWYSPQVKYAFLILLFAGPSLWACSCAPVPLDKAFALSGAIFSAEVTAVRPGPGAFSQTASVRVGRVFKGDLPSSGALEVVTANSSAACGVGFQPGESYLIWAAQRSSGQIQTNLCTPTKKLADAASDLSWLSARAR